MRWYQREEKIVGGSTRTKQHRQYEMPGRAAFGAEINIGMRVKVAKTLRKLAQIQDGVLGVFFEPMP